MGSMFSDRKEVRGVEYKNLPPGFFDDVIFYKYFISHSGFIEINPYIEMWTRTGERFYLNEGEMRDGRFERAIPFFEAMADKEEIERGNSLYLDWGKVPPGWKYYYHDSNHCFMPDAVHNVYADRMKAAAKELQAKKDETIEDTIVRLDLWRILLVRTYEDVLGINIDEAVNTYIRMDEKIHVYYEPYAGDYLYIDKITEKDVDKIRRAAVWDIEYTAKCEGLYNLIRIVIYFEKDPPLIMSYEFQREGLNYIDEDKFMDGLMNALNLDLGNKEDGYSFDEAPKGFTSFRIKDDILKTYWIRDDLYQANYSNVIEPFMNYSGHRRFLQTPICACREAAFWE